MATAFSSCLFLIVGFFVKRLHMSGVPIPLPLLSIYLPVPGVYSSSFFFGDPRWALEPATSSARRLDGFGRYEFAGFAEMFCATLYGRLMCIALPFILVDFPFPCPFFYGLVYSFRSSGSGCAFFGFRRQVFIFRFKILYIMSKDCLLHLDIKSLIMDMFHLVSGSRRWKSEEITFR